MSAIETPIMVLPPRELTTSPEWQVGETVVDGRRRWIIRALNRKTGQVALASANTVNADIWWNTTIDKLPEKTR